MLGPLFRYDLLCTSRRSRFIAVRCWYALALLAAVFCLYAGWFGFGSFGESLPRRDLAAFATDFFFTFLAAQLAAVLLLTPVYTSGAVAEEREAGRLDFLLTTELSNREIVLGKFAARLGSVGLILLTGLPILGLMQFLGGVDPNLVLAGFAATLATMLSVGSFGVFVSVHCKKASSALWLTYLGVGLTLGLCWCCPGLNLGHPAVAYDYLDQTLRGNEDLGGVLPLLMVGYAAVHGLVAFGTLSFAVNSLRPLVVRPVVVPLPAPQPLPGEIDAVTRWGMPVVVAPIEQSPSPPLPSKQTHLCPVRPQVGDNALLWKELQFCAYRVAADLRDVVILFGILIPAYCGLAGTGLLVHEGKDLGAYSHLLAKGVGVPLAVLVLLCIGLRVSASASREREQGTLDSLLTLPIDRRDILWAKWLGSILSVRLWIGALAAIWLLCTLAGGLHPLSGLLLICTFLAYAGCTSVLGLYTSVISLNRRQATLLTLGVLLLWNWVPWLLPTEFLPLSPIVGLWKLAFPPSSFHDDAARTGTIANWSDDIAVHISVIGVIFSELAGTLLWRLTKDHFEKEKGPAPRKKNTSPAASIRVSS